MGRRSLRKLDPNLDLTPYFRAIEDVPQAWEPAALFDREAPLEIEIGSGKGLFLVNAAGLCPEHNFIGIEVADKYAQHAAARLAKAKRHNAVMISGDGLRLFDAMTPENSLEAVHVYFPDPWWKKRHRKRRVLNENFLLNVQRVLRPGGTMHFWTDVKEYFETSLELIAEVVKFEGPFEIIERPAEHDMDYLTHFERRTRENEEPVYRVKYLKPE